MINYSITIRSTKPGTKKANISETKAYGVAQITENIDLNALAGHIASHGSVYGKADIAAVLTMAVSCLRELMLEGKSVQLGELGNFRPTLTTVGAKTADTFLPAVNIKKVNVKWLPGKAFGNLRNEASFQLVPSRKEQQAQLIVVRNQETIQGLE